MAASCAASEPTYAKARPSVGAPRYETATIAPRRSVSGSTSQQHPSRVAARLQGCRVYCYLPYCAPPAHTARGSQGRPTHSRGRQACRCERASAPPAGRHTCVRPGRRGQQPQACGWRGGEPTSRDQRRGTVLERSSGSKPLSPGRVPSSAGAASRKGIASDFFCQETGWGCVKPVAPALYCYRGEPPERSRG